MIKPLREEMTAYYAEYRYDRGRRTCADFPADNVRIRTDILTAMDAYAVSHPDEHPSLLKARLHEEMAERFDPVIFRHSPFFFEMGLRFSENWGTPYEPMLTPGAWLYHRTVGPVQTREEQRCINFYASKSTTSVLRLWNIHGGFDMDHHCLGTTKLLRVGLNGILAEIAVRQTEPCNAHQAANLEAMARSCRAVIRIAEKFAAKAQAMLATETDSQARRFLGMIADAALHIPAEPPRTFYEGLAMLWFLREVTATLEAIGVSVIGHLDRQLIGFYRADLAAGRISEAEARDLLARWMLPTDVKFHIEDNEWPETSTCMELGGCDEDGNVVWNKLTRLIIDVHHDGHFINPKPNCRYSEQSPQEYLELIGAAVLGGHNHFALLNDGTLIPALVRAGKSEREARLYVNGGCQEPMAEGVEHSAGAYYYYNLARILDLCLRPDTLPAGLTGEARRALPAVIDAGDFETFYQRFLAQVMTSFRAGAEWAVALGHEQWRLHPCPVLSASLEGCIDKGLDYTQGGAKYNPSGVALVGLGTVIDALTALRVAVFEEQWLTLKAFRDCLARNWDGEEALRARIRRLPRFGHGHPEADALAARFTQELADFINAVPSERGGTFQSSFFVYFFFSILGEHVRATPDGRRDYEYLTQGIAPDRATAPASLTDIFHSLSAIDFSRYPGNAVLDVQLPAGAGIPLDAFTATLRTFAALGGPTLQFNVVSVDALRDARLHPEQHRDLVVRISGLSARFVCLTPDVQEEMISRALLTV